jgi:3-deoxy-D-arabino-heptulosonate 7-phosphate (DAHP) synthase class II
MENSHTTIKGDKHVKGIRVDSKFKVTGPKRFVKAYHESGHCRFASLDEFSKISFATLARCYDCAHKA